MIRCGPMDESCILTTCLHRGPIPLAQCRAPESAKAYIETVTDIPQGSVARVLRALSRRYGACGIAAVEDGLVVGKIRCCPEGVHEKTPLCVQQEGTVRALMALDLDSLPTREEMPILRISCFQVAGGYSGRGIAGKMLDELIDWAKSAGWCTLRATAMRQIPPLLNWSGYPGCESLQRRGFVVVSQEVSSDLLQGVVAMRGGYHGPEVQQQWEPFVAVSDDEAATCFKMELEISDK